MSDSLRERVALAIEATMFAPHELPLSADLHEKYMDTAYAALAAIEASGTHAVVPLEPTEAMMPDRSALPPSLPPRGLRVLVCGGRDYDDRDHIHNTLCDIDAERGPITCVIHGMATGADHEGMIWAQMMATARPYVKHAPFRAEWRQFGKAAGPLRNARMISEGKPDLVLAFPGGAGTADCVRQARAAGIEVIEVSPRGLSRVRVERWHDR